MSKKIQNDNYFSDDDVDNDNNNDDNNDDNISISSDESLDENTKRAIYEASLRSNEELEEEWNKLSKQNNKPKKQTNNKKNTKNIITLGEFNKKIEKEIEAKKPKKFISKRVQEKKKDLEIENLPKRQFNPRLPPYTFVFKKSLNTNIDINNNNDFPTL
jgi:HD superfamily phosphohydrolase